MDSNVEQADKGQEQPELGERAKHRLRIAARLMRQRGMDFPKEGNFYGQVLSALERQADREQLRELVDWLEEYEVAER